MVGPSPSLPAPCSLKQSLKHSNNPPLIRRRFPWYLAPLISIKGRVAFGAHLGLGALNEAQGRQ